MQANVNTFQSDFKPETDDVAVVAMASPACVKVCRFVASQAERIRQTLDGKNVDAVLTELGLRFHRVIYEHLQQFQYNSMGALCAICDVNEYRKSVHDFKVFLSRCSRNYKPIFMLI